jgi:hypothetical protein
MMSETEFQIELCNRLILVRAKWLEAHCRRIRAEAEVACLKAEVLACEADIETAKYRDSLQEVA